MKSDNRFRLGAAPKGLIILFCVIGLLLTVGGALVVGMLGGARDSADKQNICRNNLRNLNVAANMYDSRLGRYPGYMNLLRRQDGNPYVNSAGNKEPVSWAVELLADLDRIQLYEEWRSTNPQPVEMRQPMMEIFVCPGHPKPGNTPRLSYVANTGMRDAPSASPANANSASGVVSAGIPRDWRANGMFFDYYSDDPLVKTKLLERGPTIVMRSGEIRDPKNRTITFTENWDATKYVYEEGYFPGGAAETEIVWGSVWGIGSVTGGGRTPIVTPPADLQRPNVGMSEAAHAADYKYCRPSSKHSGGFNVAFADGSVMLMSDRISYFVYAKLMATDDAGTKMAGTNTATDMQFSRTQLTDSDLNP